MPIMARSDDPDVIAEESRNSEDDVDVDVDVKAKDSTDGDDEKSLDDIIDAYTD